MKRWALVFAVPGLLAAAAQREMIFPAGVTTVGPYSPGIVFEDVLYVSGQGARDAQGVLPATAQEQTRQCLRNIQGVVEAARFTMANVVYTHTYLARMTDYAAVNQVYPEVFPGTLPARSTMGVARMPQETPVEISAVAVRGAAMKPVTLPGASSPVPISPGILTKDRFFLSGILGRDAEANTTPATGSAQIDLCLSRIARVLAAAQLASGNLVSLNVYRTADLGLAEVQDRFTRAFPDVAITVVEASALPFGVQVGVTGVAGLDLKEKRIVRRNGKVVCAAVNLTAYCASESADTAGEALRALDTSLRQIGSTVRNALAVNVYLNDIETFQNMNAVYALHFTQPFPTRTTVQPQRSGLSPAVRISMVASLAAPLSVAPAAQ